MASVKTLLCAITAVLAAACVHSGTGHGVLTAPETTPDGIGQPKGNATFEWQTRGNGSEGELTATLPDGRVYKGTFLQMTGSVRHETASMYWSYWQSPRWGSWGPGYYGPSTQFSTFYKGKVLAYLQAPDRSLMRCHFVLRDPSQGVRGGGQGECQLSTQEKVFGATLAPRD
jgi:hypothetical protein